MVTSVTSDNLDDIVKVPEGTVSALASPIIRAANRHVHWVDTDRHGYGVLDITAERAQMDYYVLSDRTNAERDLVLGPLVPHAQRHAEGRAASTSGALTDQTQAILRRVKGGSRRDGGWCRPQTECGHTTRRGHSARYELVSNLGTDRKFFPPCPCTRHK